MTKYKLLASNEVGSSKVEYSLLSVLIAVAALLSITFAGKSLQQTFGSVLYQSVNTVRINHSNIEPPTKPPPYLLKQ